MSYSWLDPALRGEQPASPPPVLGDLPRKTKLNTDRSEIDQYRQSISYFVGYLGFCTISKSEKFKIPLQEIPFSQPGGKATAKSLDEQMKDAIEKNKQSLAAKVILTMTFDRFTRRNGQISANVIAENESEKGANCNRLSSQTVQAADVSSSVPVSNHHAPRDIFTSPTTEKNLGSDESTGRDTHNNQQGIAAGPGAQVSATSSHLPPSNNANASNRVRSSGVTLSNSSRAPADPSEIIRLPGIPPFRRGVLPNHFRKTGKLKDDGTFDGLIQNNHTDAFLRVMKQRPLPPLQKDPQDRNKTVDAQGQRCTWHKQRTAAMKEMFDQDAQNRLRLFAFIHWCRANGLSTDLPANSQVPAAQAQASILQPLLPQGRAPRRLTAQSPAIIHDNSEDDNSEGGSTSFSSGATYPKKRGFVEYGTDMANGGEHQFDPAQKKRRIMDPVARTRGLPGGNSHEIICLNEYGLRQNFSQMTGGGGGISGLGQQLINESQQRPSHNEQPQPNYFQGFPKAGLESFGASGFSQQYYDNFQQRPNHISQSQWQSQLPSDTFASDNSGFNFDRSSNKFESHYEEISMPEYFDHDSYGANFPAKSITSVPGNNGVTKSKKRPLVDQAEDSKQTFENEAPRPMKKARSGERPPIGSHGTADVESGLQRSDLGYFQSPNECQAPSYGVKYNPSADHVPQILEQGEFWNTPAVLEPQTQFDVAPELPRSVAAWGENRTRSTLEVENHLERNPNWSAERQAQWLSNTQQAYPNALSEVVYGPSTNTAGLTMSPQSYEHENVNESADGIDQQDFTYSTEPR